MSASQSLLTIALTASIALQFGAAVLALRLIGVAGRLRAWLFISFAIVGMTVRRLFSLWGVFSGELVSPQELNFEIVGLVTSVLMFAGIALIRPLFVSFQNSEAALREIGEFRRLLLENTRDIVYRHDREGVFTYVSPAAERVSGYTAQEWMKNYQLFHSANPANKVAVQRTEEALRSGKEQPPFEVEILHKSGTPIWLEVSERPYVIAGKVAGIIGVARDATRRKEVEAERERLIAELREANASIKILRGFLPICASCKKIRDDKGYWNQIESYIRDHSEAEFSHGLCPECAGRLYPEIFPAADPNGRDAEDRDRT